MSIREEFDRTQGVADDWGTGDLGVWTDYGTNYADCTIDGDIASAAAHASTIYAAIDSVIVDQGDDIEVHWRWRWHNSITGRFIDFGLFTPTSFDEAIGLALEYDSGSTDTTFVLYWYDTVDDDATTDIVVGTGNPTDSWANVKLGVDRSTGEVRGKYWLEGDVEPSFEILSGANSLAGLTDNPGIYWYTNGGPSTPTYQFDFVEMTGAGGAQDISLALIDQTGVLFSPTVANPGEVFVDLINQTATCFTPTVTTGAVTVDLGLIDNTATAHSPAVANVLGLALINQTAVIFAPTVFQQQVIALGRITQTAAAFEPTIHPISLVFGLLDQTGEPYPPTVSSIYVPGPTPGPGPGRGPGSPGAGGVGSIVVIRVDGVDITDDVQILEAAFISQVNGAIGQAQFKVKDADQTYMFNSGDSLTLDINGDRVWGGYVMIAKKVQTLVVRTNEPAEVVRIWEISGVDYNVLFHKRVVYKASDPDGKIDFSYDATVYDDTIIRDIYDNYLDIGSDGLTRTGVTRIARPILDVPGKTHRGQVASAGFTWKDMMDSVQRATGGVYYISPTKVLTYVDAEIVTSAYPLTDQPNGGNDVGYQSISILEDGTQMVNDMFVWGTGGASPNYIISRTEDSASIAAHGRWQLALVSGALYRQASADIVADSYVYGTPQSHRGGKDDGVVFSVRTFAPTHRAGDIVDLTCGIFDYADSLPLRRMQTTFLGPNEPIFDLMLSHMIDLPVGISEYYFRFDIPKFGGIDRVPQFETEGGCTDCGVTDGFGRADQSGFGYSDEGTEWELGGASPAGTPTPTASIVDGQGRLNIAGGGPGLGQVYLIGQQLRGLPLYLSTVRFDVIFTSWQDVATDNTRIEFSALHNGFGLTVRNRKVGSGAVQRELVLQHFGTGLETAITFDPSLSVTYHVLWEISTAERRVKFYTGAEPGTWDITQTASRSLTAPPIFFQFDLYGGNNDGGLTGVVVPELEVFVDTLQLWSGILQIDRCSASQFETFNNRSETSTWGTSSGGYVWDPIDNPSHQSVSSNRGRFNLPGGTDTTARVTDASGPWAGDSYTMTMQFQVTADVAAAKVYILLLTLSNNDITFQMSSVAGPPITGTAKSYITIGGGSPVWVDPTFWEEDTLYTVTVTFDNGTLTATISDGTNSYEVSGAGSADNEFRVRGECFGTTTQNFYFWDIDFDYAGRPCYASPCVIVDSFNRTSSSWGVADNGSTWATTGGSFSQGVNGTHGRVSDEEGEFTELTLTYSPGDLDVTFNDMYFDATGAGPSDLSVTFTAFGDGLEFVLTDHSVAFSLEELDDDIELGSGWESDPVNVRLVMSSARVFADYYVWRNSGSMPSTPTGTLTPSAPSDRAITEIKVAALGNMFGAGTTDWYIGNIQEGPCSAGPQPGTGVPASGYVCEEIAGTGVAEYSTSNTFAALSTRVWVDGLRQSRLLHYLETGTSEIGFTTPPSSGSVIKVCYTATGPA